MRICLTGGGGYLGTVLAECLLLEGQKLTILDRFSWGTQPLMSVTRGSAVRVIVGDVRDPAAVEQALLGADAVIHLAGIVGYPACDADPADADSTNVEGTRQLCLRLKGRPLLFASTGSTYGKVQGLASEDLPISPLTRYGRNKAEAELIVRDVGGVCLRFATLYGPSPRMRWDLLPHTFAQEAERGEIRLYEGEASRTFLHVEDAAELILAALVTGLDRGGVYNAGHLEGNLTKRQVARAAQAVTGCRITEAAGQDPDQRDYRVDFRKLQTALPTWSADPFKLLGVAMAELVAWARVWERGEGPGRRAR